MRFWWMRRLLAPTPGEPGGNPAGEPAAPKSTDPAPEPKPEPAPADPKKDDSPKDPKLAEARADAIKERKRRQDLETKLEELTAQGAEFKKGLAKLLGIGDEDDPKKAAETAVKERDHYKSQAEKTLIFSALISEAVKAGSHDPEAAAALASRSELKVNLETGQVEGAAEAMAALIKDKPYLIKTASTPKNPPAGGTPPAADPSGSGLTQEQYDKLKADAKADPRAMRAFEKALPKARELKLKL